MNIVLHRVASLLFALFALVAIAHADKVTLTDGTVIDGNITTSEGDTIKIEVLTHTPAKGIIFIEELAVGSTIKDTKIIPKGKIEKIERPNPDDTRFEELEKLLPTKSLVGSADYRTMIQNGPTRFLTEFPTSPHREAVEKIQQELNDELAKIEGGFIKIQGRWITADDREAHPLNVDAQVSAYNMLSKAQEGDYLAALRDFEAIETNYQGSTSYSGAVEAALKVLPIYGRRLQGQLRTLEYTLAEQAKNLTRLTEPERLKHQKIMAEEMARFRKQAEAAKIAKVRWRPVNQRDGESLKSTLGIVSKEIQRLKALDLESLQKRAEGLYEVETLVAKGELDEASTKLKTALGIRARGSSSKDPFVANIVKRIETARAKIAQEEALATRNQTESGQLTAALTGGAKPETTTPTDPGSDETEATPPVEEIDPLVAAIQGRKSPNTPAAKTKKKDTPKKKPTAKKPKKTTAAAPSGGGFSFKYILFALPVILIGTTAVIYLKDQKQKAGGE